MQYAMLFPGQGSQAVGMLARLGEQYPIVRQTFEQGSDALGVNLWRLAHTGPEDELNLTRNTQPVLLAAGVAVWRVWRSLGDQPAPVLMAGHSLGEYTALTCAGAIDYPAAVRLVARRGQMMQDALATGEGGMAAIVGLADEQVQEICRQQAGTEVLEAVNYNAPGQVVIAGHRAAVERGIEAAQDAGAKLATKLSVSVPAHSSLMSTAARQLREALADIPLAVPAIPVLHNVDAQPRHSSQAIKQALVEQLSSPVKWVECIRRLQRDGVRLLLECGPGKVLTGLNRRIDRSLSTATLSQPAAFEQALENVHQS